MIIVPPVPVNAQTSPIEDEYDWQGVAAYPVYGDPAKWGKTRHDAYEQIYKACDGSYEVWEEGDRLTCPNGAGPGEGERQPSNPQPGPAAQRRDHARADRSTATGERLHRRRELVAMLHECALPVAFRRHGCRLSNRSVA